MLIDRQMLLGVGVGLLLAATLSAFGGGARRPLSRVEVIREARALGMSFPDEARLNLGTTPEVQAAKPTTDAEPAVAPAPSGAVAPRIDRPVRTVGVIIPPGATGAEVARHLKGKGLIADEQEFLALAVAQRAATRFVPGTYQFPKDITVKALIAALSKGPQAE